MAHSIFGVHTHFQLEIFALTIEQVDAIAVRDTIRIREKRK